MMLDSPIHIRAVACRSQLTRRAIQQYCNILQLRRLNCFNVTVIILKGVTTKIFPGPDFPGRKRSFSCVASLPGFFVLAGGGG